MGKPPSQDRHLHHYIPSKFVFGIVDVYNPLESMRMSCMYPNFVAMCSFTPKYIVLGKKTRVQTESSGLVTAIWPASPNLHFW